MPASKSRPRAPFLVDRDQRRDVGIGHRTAVGAPGERAEDLPRARLFVARRRGTAREDPLPARRGLRRLAVERPGDVQHVDAGPVRIVAAEQPAAPRDALGRRRAVGEAGRHQPGAGLDRQPDFQRAVGVHAVVVQHLAVLVVLGHGDEHAGIGPLVLAADRELLDELVIDAQLDLVLVLVDPFDRADRAVPLHPDAELVLAVERERVANGQAAVGRKRHVLAGAQGAALEPDLVDLGDRTVLGAAHRGAADLGRRRDVARHQRRRDRQDVGVVVEAEARHVARQQLGAVHLEAEQVVDGVHVFGAIQAARGDAARIGLRGGVAVERALESGDERVHRRLVGPRPAFGRHRAAAQLPHHLLHHRRVARDVGQIDARQGQFAALQPIVVAADAVLIDERPAGAAAAARGAAWAAAASSVDRAAPAPVDTIAGHRERR